MRTSFWLLVALVPFAPAQEATLPGEPSSPPPTTRPRPIEGPGRGAAEGDGAGGVRYRARGETAWREAMGLFRVSAGRSRDTTPVYVWGDKHSGSLFGLAPDTEYEIELALEDPDGGSCRRLLEARTRPVPRPPRDLPEVRVDPSTIRKSIGSGGPGRILLLAAGDYGDLDVAASGEPGRPLVLRAQGEARFRRVVLGGCRWVHLEGLTVRGSIDLTGATDCVVRYCRVELAGGWFAIGVSGRPGTTRAYVADNVVLGPNPWTREAMGAEGRNHGEGIQITGPGNVVCYNRVQGFRDGISTLEESAAQEQVSIDVYGNDVSTCVDDAIEADFTMGNCRVLENRITHAFCGLSSQPGLGGPTWFVRNVMYDVTHCSFKLHRFSQGDVCLHNTVVKIGDGMCCFTWETFDHAFFRNNLALGGPPGEGDFGGYSPGDGLAASMARPGPASSFDYDALGSHGLPFRARFGDWRVSRFEDLQGGPHEEHAVLVDLDVFDGVRFPDPSDRCDPPDLRPRPGSAVVDRGMRLIGVNDGFDGAAPDIGAYEAGRPLPHYGPRSPGVDEGPG